MKKEVILKNSVRLALSLAIFATIATLICAGIGFLIDYTININGKHENVKLVLIIFACLIASYWLLFAVSVLFSSKIIVSEEEIKVMRFKKVKWVIAKKDIRVCIYQELRWWHFLIPMASINSGALQFKLQNGKISKHYCSLNRKQVDCIKAKFDYPFREIQSIYEQ